MSSKLKILNLETAHFDCVFPTCGGICCKNGRPGVEPVEGERIAENLEKFLPHLRPAARRAIEKNGFLTQRKKEGRRMLAVQDEWCVFANDGCVLHKVGASEGDRWKYKPWLCITFPLELAKDDETWHVRQWGVRGEAWDVFCLNPKESPKPASESLASEVKFAEELKGGTEGWRRGG